MSAGRELLFYSDFPLGYHNAEAERKMELFAERGYRVTYVEQLGLRNPSPRHLLRVAGRMRRTRVPTTAGGPFAVLSPRLLPPRRLPPVDRWNERWLARQMLAPLREPGSAILWIRYATPELLPLVESGRLGLVVYEAVDDHERSPGMPPHLRRAFAAAERRILRRAAVVFAWSRPIRDRLAQLHPNVVLAPAAVDPAAFAGALDARPQERVAGYVGALDFRFDVERLLGVARRLPDWRFDLAGPADPAVRRRLERQANVRLLGRVPRAGASELMGAASVCLMPYRVTTFTQNLFPIKLVEYLAAGRPVASVPLAALTDFADVVEIAHGPEGFAAAIERAASRDAATDRRRRAARADPYAWSRRIDEMQQAIEAAIVRG